MYSDPSLIRTHHVKLSFNENEARLVDAYIAYTGQEKAAFLRQLVLDQAVAVLHGSDAASSGSAMRGAGQSLSVA